MKTQAEQIEIIHESLVNGQRRQMVSQIEEFGLYDFWPAYRYFLNDLYVEIESRFVYFADAVESYFKITQR